MRNILDTLKSEHDELRSLYQQLTATSDERDDERRGLVQRIESVLIPHAKWEELVFYPAFGERANHEQQLLYSAAMQEHRAIEQSVLPDLHAADFDSRQFAGSAKVLAELTTHHAEEEETQIFAAARTMFSPQELAELDEQYEEWKESGVATALEMHAKVKTAAKSIFRMPRAPG
ncbi:hemerythrin domain-containing protein [Lysobacter korlensis]|uniref:Hemerythrin domain-containing protein n=1 Tax=Lysobacter korlensis TaxID=553636 RepID=A0ABV6RIF4_9GAMM